MMTVFALISSSSFLQNRIKIPFIYGLNNTEYPVSPHQINKFTITPQTPEHLPMSISYGEHLHRFAKAFTFLYGESQKVNRTSWVCHEKYNQKN
jgi:hypothetical protein